MAYATQTHLEDAFGADEVLQIADRDRDGLPDAGFVDAALDRADSLIDGYLAGRYALPVSPVPPVLTAAACDLARYWLYDDAAPDRVRQAFEDAMVYLQAVAAGKVLLQLPAAAAGVSAGSPDWDAPPRLFSAETLAGY